MIDESDGYPKKDRYASGVIYSPTKPVCDSLPPLHRKKVSGRIGSYNGNKFKDMRGQ